MALSLENTVDALVSLFLIMLPAMAANGAPVVVGHYLKSKGRKPHPVDGGRRWRDGRRILGDGKTWEGLIAGILVGAMVGVLFSSYIVGDLLAGAIVGAVSGLGALLGDMAASFLKRRLNIPRGESAPILDQLDFYVCALIALVALDYASKSLNLSIDPIAAIVFAPLIVVLHRLTNFLAYKLGMKDKPY